MLNADLTQYQTVRIKLLSHPPPITKRFKNDIKVFKPALKHHFPSHSFYLENLFLTKNSQLYPNIYEIMFLRS